MVSHAEESDSTTVSVLVVSYNTREMTLEAIRSLRATTSIEYEIIVVDNASTDESAEAIKRTFPDVTLIASLTNHGFASGNNLAAERAKGEYLLLLNPDTVVLPGAVDNLISFARSEPNARIWGGRTVTEEGLLDPKNAWGRMTLWSILCNALGISRLAQRSRLLNSEEIPSWDRNCDADVDIVSGCFFLIERDFWESLGGFDRRFVMYGEEADLCLRARAHGARPRVTASSEIVHFGGASETVRVDKMVKLFRAKLTLVEKHFPTWQRAPARTLFTIWPKTRSAILRLLGDENWRTWDQISRRRNEWIGGYPAVADREKMEEFAQQDRIN